ncbi:DNA protecting protein DprA [Paramicrobacterium humi]|uniref:DNA protecting protein DprA n=1 Tax=Paramicrobacterium humi TaxID=640635 RepID=A0A1H4TP83_9MICO|nr:DNA-processing protein DprA [Microbacterium humi]SEC58080.1 DNA protecting protein DprA [Microbacterium humi]
MVNTPLSTDWAQPSDIRQREADRDARAFWLCVAEPGDSAAYGLIAALGPQHALELICSGTSAEKIVEEVLATVDADAIYVSDLTRTIGAALDRWSPRANETAYERAALAAKRAGARLVIPGDDEWPAAVDDLGEHAPLGLWMLGENSALTAPAVAVVGSRAATGYGEHVTMEIAGGLAGRGFTVVSGAAYGIDGAAHRAALGVGGSTVAFLAGGVDRPYPQGHSELLDAIRRTGTVVSEMPCGGQPTKWRFLQRNRLIAAVASATIVVEAGWRSGSLNTAAHASSLGRALGAVPGPVTSPASVGCHRLIREYDAICVTDADDVAELAGFAAHEHSSAALRDPDETRVLDALSSRRARATSDIAQRSGLPIERVRGVLGILDVLGEARESPEGWMSVPIR